MNFIPRLNKELIFPNPRAAPDNFPLAFGGDLSANRLILAYKKGIFPWFNEDDPILWWSPNPRTILFLDEYKPSKNLLKIVRKNRFEVRIDTDFMGVISGCQRVKRVGQSGTWITEEIIDAYCELHEMGFAHSFECYMEGALAGGLYGVSLGRAFFGESMFSDVDDASKVALYHLVEFCKANGFDFIDAQVKTEHMIKQGAREIDRELFLDMLDETLKKSTMAEKWEIDKNTGFSV